MQVAYLYNACMTKLLEEAVARVRILPESEQDRVAEAILALTREESNYTLSAQQIEGIKHAMAQADRGEFADAQKIAGHLPARAMKLRVTEDAASDLSEVKAHIAKDDRAAAERVLYRIEQG